MRVPGSRTMSPVRRFIDWSDLRHKHKRARGSVCLDSRAYKTQFNTLHTHSRYFERRFAHENYLFTRVKDSSHHSSDENWLPTPVSCFPLLRTQFFSMRTGLIVWEPVQTPVRPHWLAWWNFLLKNGILRRVPEPRGFRTLCWPPFHCSFGS